MQQTIPQAAKLYGKARSTIHRAIDAGRLSCTVRGDGVRVVDLAELIRLWGEPPHRPAVAQQNATAGEAATQQPAQQAMLDELRAMRELYLAGLEENRALRREVRELKEVMLRLPAPQPAQEYPPGRPTRPSGADSAPTPAMTDPHGLRALVQAIRGDQGK